MELLRRVRDANGKPVNERQPKVSEVVEWLREQGVGEELVSHPGSRKLWLEPGRYLVLELPPTEKEDT